MAAKNILIPQLLLLLLLWGVFSLLEFMHQCWFIESPFAFLIEIE